MKVPTKYLLERLAPLLLLSQIPGLALLGQQPNLPVKIGDLGPEHSQHFGRKAGGQQHPGALPKAQVQHWGLQGEGTHQPRVHRIKHSNRAVDGRGEEQVLVLRGRHGQHHFAVLAVEPALYLPGEDVGHGELLVLARGDDHPLALQEQEEVDRARVLLQNLGLVGQLVVEEQRPGFRRPADSETKVVTAVETPRVKNLEEARRLGAHRAAARVGLSKHAAVLHSEEHDRGPDDQADRGRGAGQAREKSHRVAVDVVDVHPFPEARGQQDFGVVLDEGF